MSDQYIQIFLDNFNYLDSKGKRSGFLLFNNVELTKDLEAIAYLLKSKLEQLLSEQCKTSIESIEKFDSFMSDIKSSFDQARIAREDRAELKTVFYTVPVSSLSHKRILIDYDYKTPYSPSKFEAELISGLNAVLQALEKDKVLDSDLDSFYSDCSEFLNFMQNFTPEIKIIENRSFSP